MRRHIDEQIRRARRESGLSREALAERIGVAPAALHRYEEGARISTRHLELIAVATGKPVSYFLDGSGAEAHKATGIGGWLRAAIAWLSEPASSEDGSELLAELTARERSLAQRERVLSRRERALASPPEGESRVASDEVLGLPEDLAHEHRLNEKLMAELDEARGALVAERDAVEERERAVEQARRALERLRAELDRLAARAQQVERQERALEERQGALAGAEEELSSRAAELGRREAAAAELEGRLAEQAERAAELGARAAELEQREQVLTRDLSEFEGLRASLESRAQELDRQSAGLAEATAGLEQRRAELDRLAAR